VGLERPDFHFPEPLPAESRLATERLLRDERVGTGRASVDLVVDQVVQLHHIDVAHGGFLLERLAGAAIVKLGLAVLRKLGGSQALNNGLFRRSIENRSNRLETQESAGPAEMRFE